MCIKFKSNAEYHNNEHPKEQIFIYLFFLMLPEVSKKWRKVNSLNNFLLTGGYESFNVGKFFVYP